MQLGWRARVVWSENKNCLSEFSCLLLADDMADANSIIGGVPVLKYFDLKAFKGVAGRGGCVRFFFLQSGINFTDDKIVWAEWASTLKQKAIESGEAPSGLLPVVRLGDRVLLECHAVMRYLSKKLGSYGQDPERDYQVDQFADASVGFRGSWAGALLEGPAAKEAHVGKRPALYDLFEGLMVRFGAQGAHAVGASASFADALVFCQLWDDAAFFDGGLLAQHPRLAAFFAAYKAQPAVAAWCQEMRPDV